MRYIALAVLLVVALAPSSAGIAGPRRESARMAATAYSDHLQRTSAGTIPHEGIVAADPAVLPLGSRIRVIDAGTYSGIYTVMDTGSKVKGLHIDVYVPSFAAAKKFGRKLVLVQVLETGKGKKDAREKDGMVAGTEC